MDNLVVDILALLDLHQVKYLIETLEGIGLADRIGPLLNFCSLVLVWIKSWS